ncbi:MAG TPA: hypothetical protein VFS00_21190 [Polyangiaceae bacterium]|nr:hypothetical protein [Polyangiaceae bacterium]
MLTLCPPLRRPAPRRPAPRRRAAGPRALGLAAALASAGGCLPGDERPPPGIVSVSLEGAPGLDARAPVTTDDGWAVTFDRVLVASSGVSEEGSSETTADGVSPCEGYYDTSMRAIYDLVVPGPRPLGNFAGLGECGFNVSWGRLGLSPDVLGPGVSLDDVRAIAASAQATGSRGLPALYVAGSATDGTRQKSFAWPFSPRVLFFGACGRPRRALAFRRRFDEGAALAAAVTVHPAWLFADVADGPAPRLRFGPLADADERGDGDGAITRAELEKLPLADLAGGDGTYALLPSTPPPLDAEGNPRPPALIDFVGLLAGRAFYNDGRDPCSADLPPGG